MSPAEPKSPASTSSRAASSSLPLSRRYSPRICAAARVLARGAQRLGRLRHVPGVLEAVGGLLVPAVPHGHLARRRPALALLEHAGRGLEVAGLLVELAGLEHELLQLLVRLRSWPAPVLFDLLGDRELERVRGLGPVLHLHEGLRRVAVELAAHVALAGEQIAVRLLVHLGGDAHAAALAVAVGGLLVLVLRGVERARGVELPGLQVELGGLGEAVLVAADLGGLAPARTASR